MAIIVQLEKVFLESFQLNAQGQRRSNRSKCMHDFHCHEIPIFLNSEQTSSPSLSLLIIQEYQHGIPSEGYTCHFIKITTDQCH